MKGFVGFADTYLKICIEVLKSDYLIDIKAYSELVQLDSKIGTSASKQLLQCLKYTTRKDIIEVRF